MKWLLIIIGINNSGDLKPETGWEDFPTLEACKAAGDIVSRTIPARGHTITGMSCIGHDAVNTVDFHFHADGGWQ